MRTRWLSYGRGTGSYIRARSGAAKIIRRVCEAKGQIRVGPDHGPEPRGLRSLPSAGRSQGGEYAPPVAGRLEDGRRTEDCPWCQAIKHRVTRKPQGRPWASTSARIWFAEGPRGRARRHSLDLNMA